MNVMLSWRARARRTPWNQTIVLPTDERPPRLLRLRLPRVAVAVAVAVLVARVVIHRSSTATALNWSRAPRPPRTSTRGASEALVCKLGLPLTTPAGSALPFPVLLTKATTGSALSSAQRKCLSNFVRGDIANSAAGAQALRSSQGLRDAVAALGEPEPVERQRQEHVSASGKTVETPRKGTRREQDTTVTPEARLDDVDHHHHHHCHFSDSAQFPNTDTDTDTDMLDSDTRAQATEALDTNTRAQATEALVEWSAALESVVGYHNLRNRDERKDERYLSPTVVSLTVDEDVEGPGAGPGEQAQKMQKKKKMTQLGRELTR